LIQKNPKIKAVRNQPKTDAAHPPLVKLANQTRTLIVNVNFTPMPASLSLGSNSDQQPCHAMHLFLHGRFRKAEETKSINKFRDHEKKIARPRSAPI
jgi:hypothetical protein